MNNFPNQKGKSRIRTSDIYDKGRSSYHINKNNQKKNNDNSPNIEDFLRFALILCSLRSSAQELQHI
ncbi:hypothetical protein BCR32DRAFT_287818 [Anaeromyces robustus]|uniref:Uncharacterized protein n=1 Tax=Anaeromyces robustus TaxID=1754192 RepID=A0A1Y1VPX8_9FUNG|nr:hypothetical protein BCR32DRAFT_287818 [Anaeromyces robustus]|eukprot:ORX63368.1 hypothetical protein BCR32DRAFT_287818 [Anaeromyces robustus]